MLPGGNIMSCCRMYRMMRHRMQRQQIPPRQKVSKDILHAHHPCFDIPTYLIHNNRAHCNILHIKASQMSKDASNQCYPWQKVSGIPNVLPPSFFSKETFCASFGIRQQSVESPVFSPHHRPGILWCWPSDGLFSWTLLFSDSLHYNWWTITLQLCKQKNSLFLHYPSISYVGIVQICNNPTYSTIQQTPPPWWAVCCYGGLALENWPTPPLRASSEGVIWCRGERV